MTITRIKTCLFFETEPTVAHPVPLTRYIFGIGWCFRWEHRRSDSGISVWLVGPFTYVNMDSVS